jgi:hypothetical protein
LSGLACYYCGTMRDSAPESFLKRAVKTIAYIVVFVAVAIVAHEYPALGEIWLWLFWGIVALWTGAVIIHIVVGWAGKKNEDRLDALERKVRDLEREAERNR